MPAQPSPSGLERVAAALEAESFPTSKENLYYAIGDMILETAGGREVPVRDVLDQVEASSFQTAVDAVAALRDSLEHLAVAPGEVPAEAAGDASRELPAPGGESE